MVKAIVVREYGGAGSNEVGGRDDRRAGAGRGAGEARGDRDQLRRRLQSHRPLQDPAALYARRRGCRHRGLRWPRHHACETRRPGRLFRAARLLRRGAHPAGRPADQDTRRDRLQDRRGDDAEGADGAVSPAPDLPGEEGRHDPLPRSRRRRRVDRRPVGEPSRRDRHRHRRVGGEGEARQGARLPSRHQLQDGELRRARRRDHRRQEMRRGLRLRSAATPIRVRSIASDRWACGCSSASPPA